MRQVPISFGRKQTALGFDLGETTAMGKVVTPCLPGSGSRRMILVLFCCSSLSLTGEKKSKMET